MAKTIITLGVLLFVLAVTASFFAGHMMSNGQGDGERIKTLEEVGKRGGVINEESVYKPYRAMALQPIRGMTINVYHTEDIQLYLRAIDGIHEMGFNALQINTPAFMENSSSQRIELKTGSGFGPTAEMLTNILLYAKSKGMRTALMPQIDLYKPRGNEWRGKIHPVNWGIWWGSYNEMMDYYLLIANEAAVDMFSVGCELISTEKREQASNWKLAIENIRRQYGGYLYYSTNWDHYTAPPFWKELDAIGINGYWDLTTLAENSEQVSNEELAKRWSEIRQEVLNFARKMNRPVLFTEVGYPSLPWGLKDPWNYVSEEKAKPSPEIQLRGYESFLNAWSDLLLVRHTESKNRNGELAIPPTPEEFQKDPIMGVFFFKWDVYAKAVSLDTGYSVMGKPAEKLLKDFLRQPPKPISELQTQDQ